MRFKALLLPTLCAALVAGCTPGTKPASTPPPREPVLQLETHGSTAPDQVRTLVVVLHDDGDPGARADEAAFADVAPRILPNTVAVTILRPGHVDAQGRRSPGDRGLGKGDDFTIDRLAAIGAEIVELKRRYPRANVVLVGDGGGAAMVANLAGLHPGLADAVLLVGCPCALPEWRTHMATRTRDKAWRAPVTSLDPLKTAGGVPTTLRVVVLVGANDKITPVKLSRAYVEALTLRGIATDYRIVPGAGHDLLVNPEGAMAALAQLAARLPEKP